MPSAAMAGVWVVRFGGSGGGQRYWAITITNSDMCVRGRGGRRGQGANHGGHQHGSAVGVCVRERARACVPVCVCVCVRVPSHLAQTADASL